MSAPPPLVRNALLTALVAFGALSVDIVIPALPRIAQVLGASTATAQLTLSVFVAGFAISQLAYGPLSDRFGRKPVLIGGLVLFVAGSAACVLAGDIGELIAARFLQSIGGCAGPVLARAIVRDVYGREGSARVLAYMASVMGVLPAAAAILCGFLVASFDWQSLFVALGAFGLASLLGTLTLLDETNLWKDRTATAPRQIARNYRSLLADRAFLSFVVALGGTYGGMFSFHSLSAFVLIEQFGVAAEHYGFYFLAIAAGFMTGSLIAGRLSPRLGHERMVTIGFAIQIGAAGVLCALGWARIDAPMAVIGPMAVFLVGCGFVFPNAMAGGIAPHTTMAGTASALLGFAQMAIGAAVGTVVSLFHDGTQSALVTGVLVCAVVAFAAFTLLSPAEGRAG